MVQTRRTKSSSEHGPGAGTISNVAHASPSLPPLHKSNIIHSAKKGDTASASKRESGDVKNVKRRASFSHLPPSLPKLPPSVSLQRPPRVRAFGQSSNSISTAGPTKQSSSITQEPTATKEKSHHFLKGFNLDSCQDLLSIPDPPSPKSKPTKRRRQSTSFLKSSTSTCDTLPLKDVTNDFENSALSSTDKSSDRMKKKKRQSLCHVPSPDIQEPPRKKHSPDNKTKTNNGEELAPKRETKESEKAKQNLEEGAESRQLQKQDWDLGDSDQEMNGRKHSSTRKRCKRRQSILLPSEEDLKEISSNILSPPNQKLSLPTHSEKDGDSKSVDSKANADLSTKAKFAEVQALVRAYCSLPKDSQKVVEYANLIRTKTGYSLPVPIGVTNTQKRGDLLSKISPILELMDRQKTAQKEYAEQKTQCKTEKTRKGRYRYRDRAGQKIPPEEYKLRYIQMLNEQKQAKAEGLTLALKQLGSFEEKELSSTHEENAGPMQEETSPSSSKKTRDKVDDVEDLDKAFVDENEEGEDDDMDITNCSVDLGEIGLASLHSPDLASVPKPEIFETRAAEQKQLASSPEQLAGVQKTKETAACENHYSTDCVNDQSDTTATTAGSSPTREESQASRDSLSAGAKEDKFILPIPSRDGESDDPEIASAENKLWEAIDKALETYSQEVLEIQARRRAEYAARQRGTVEFS